MVKRKIFWGVFFIAAAALLVANQMGYFMDVGFWSLLFTLALVPVIIESALHLTFTGIFFPVALLAIIYQGPLGIESLVPWTVLIAALLLSIGFHLIFRKKNKWGKYWDHGEWKNGRKLTADTENVNGEIVECHVNLGASCKYIHSDNLKIANLSCKLGALEVYFDNCTPAEGGATVNLSCRLGAIQLYIPKDWTVRKGVSAVLGGIEEHGNPNNIGPVLILDGEVSLGGIEIYYI